MAFTQSSEPAPTVVKFEFLDSASPVYISTIGPTADERLEEAARDDFVVRSVAVASSCFNGLLCSDQQRSPLNTVPSLKILAHYIVWTVKEVMRVATVISFLTNLMHEIPAGDLFSPATSSAAFPSPRATLPPISTSRTGEVTRNRGGEDCCHSAIVLFQLVGTFFSSSAQSGST